MMAALMGIFQFAPPPYFHVQLPVIPAELSVVRKSVTAVASNIKKDQCSTHHHQIS